MQKNPILKQFSLIFIQKLHYIMFSFIHISDVCKQKQMILS